MPRCRQTLEFFALVIAGEAIFGLPFHVARFFRPTLLGALGLTNTELGALFSVYGVVALLCYAPGGVLADRIPVRRLICGSLLLTGGGGALMLGLTDLRALLILFAFFGVTTILTFWAALIRAVRELGGPDTQGRSFGGLEAGRGLVAAGLASLALLSLQTDLAGGATPDVGRLAALRGVLLVYVAATLVAAALVWVLVPARPACAASAPAGSAGYTRDLLRRPVIWLHGLVVVSAYCGFKSIDNFALFVVDACGMDEAEGARVSVLSAWIRPAAALGAGLLADRLVPTRVVQCCFVGLVAGFLVLATSECGPGALAPLWLGVASVCTAVFALRATYFAIVEELRVPNEQTGTVVGLVSTMGFLPDVFLGPLTGSLLDASPGAAGHRQVFIFFAASALVGLLASLSLGRFARRAPEVERRSTLPSGARTRGGE